MSEATSSSAGGEVRVKIDLSEVKAKGALFFKEYERLLEAEFRKLMILALKMAQSLAPKGDHNYAIEDLDEVRRAGGSTSSRPGNPGGFAIQNSAKFAIHKVAGGTLRRALTMAVTTEGELVSAKLGVPSSSPAAKYAHIAEIGGTIAAKNVRYLRFSPDGQVVIFKPVVHRAPHPYVIPALMYVWPLVQKLPQEVFELAKAAI